MSPVRQALAALRPRHLVVALALGTAMASTLAVAPAQAATCRLTVTLRQGSRSEQVRCLEQRLRELGYGLTGPDTSFGASTNAAVRGFQRAQHLFVDGVVGPVTRAALGLDAATNGPPALVDPVPAAVTETVVIGHSVEGRDITAYRMGTPGGRVVLAIGIIHGDEQKGAEITRLVRTMATPQGVDLWLVDSINPDGVAANTRTNANGVDLNRNFPVKWGYIPKDPAHGQYSGEHPSDQPETQALEAFVTQIQPAVVLWYHQDANTLSINGARKQIPTAYGRWTGLVARNVPCSQGCTGTASTYINTAVKGSTSFIVELPGSSRVDDATVQRHAAALLGAVTL
jgi:murein peptide amidase A